jgi:hypothetical protein
MNAAAQSDLPIKRQASAVAKAKLPKSEIARTLEVTKKDIDANSELKASKGTSAI